MSDPSLREYKRLWMRDKRRDDPEYYARELEHQRLHRHRKSRAKVDKFGNPYRKDPNINRRRKSWTQKWNPK